jgi:DNA-binding MarR family transcriptional regulator
MEQSIQNYLHDVLGLRITKLAMSNRAASLPYYLQDTFSFRQIRLAGYDVTLAIPKAEAKNEPQFTFKNIRTQLDFAHSLLETPIIFCPESLASYERRNLIEQKISFIVPGKQMYLPELGIDLRESFRNANPIKTEQCSPATQALLFCYLLNHSTTNQWHPGEIGANLGYTPMTISRVVRELQTLGLAESVTVGRAKWLHMPKTKAETWNDAQRYLRSPIKRIVWCKENLNSKQSEIRFAGLSALAKLSMLTEPSTPCKAISLGMWNAALENGVKEYPQPVPGAKEWQVWTYSPTMITKSKTVDPLSLWLSLKDESNERVQIALDKLQDSFIW